MNIIDLINKKRMKDALSYDELKHIIDGYMNDSIKDYQISALLMAICLNGMEEAEIYSLTKIMLESGDKFDLSPVLGLKVDKHSTGGVGDKTTLVVAPLVASCDVVVAKMSGRSLGYTGGTIDKLESIPGFKVNLTEEEFISQLNNIGVAITTSSLNFVPADKKIYALRDVTGTVSSIPLIASSIMSKKLAMGTDKIVLDVKVGRGSFMATKEEATKLAETMINIGHYFNKETVAIITNMDYPLGSSVGNALEVLEAIDTLKGNGEENFIKLCVTLASYMVSLGKNITVDEAGKLVIENLSNGKAYAKFKEMIIHQQGNIDDIKLSSDIVELKAPKEGYINDIDALEIGKICMSLGAGRLNKEDVIDLKVGLTLNKKVGDYVTKDDVIAKLYVGEKKIDYDDVIKAFKIGVEKETPKPLIYDIIK